VTTFLLTYNPEKGGDFSNYEEGVKLTAQGRPYEDTWRVKSGEIKVGDTVFVLRQGSSRPGLIAKGEVIKGSYRSAANRDGSGREGFRVDVRFRMVLSLNNKLVSWPLPSRANGGKFKGPYGSGDSVPADLASAIETAWRRDIEVKEGRFDLAAVLSGEQERVEQDIQRRQGQAEFRALLMEAYGNRCALSDCDVTPALEAAHIVAYTGAAANHVQNGILLRADLHTLFDLALFTIDPLTYTVSIDQALDGTAYEWLSGKKLKEPTMLIWRPSAEALQYKSQVEFEKH